jgi:hypothetical protein
MDMPNRSRLYAIKERRAAIEKDAWLACNPDQREIAPEHCIAYAQGIHHVSFNEVQKEEAWSKAAREQAIINCLPGDIDYLLARCDMLLRWVDDLQSGMYVNCVYCGHRYGPGETTPVSMADALKAHVEQCPEHPMSELKAKNDQLRARNDELWRMIGDRTGNA